MAAEPEFFNPRAEIETHSRRLPHWRQGRTAVFITWRLADSLPAELLARWRIERDDWLRAHPEPWDVDIEESYHARFSNQFDTWLDAGTGSCVVRDPAVRSVLNEVLTSRNEIDYELHAFVLMPNHAHVLFSPKGSHAWQRIVGTRKSVSAHRINRLLGRRGSLWQEESWDRLVRHARHFAACTNYIRANPERAKLRPDDFTLFEAVEE